MWMSILLFSLLFIISFIFLYSSYLPIKKTQALLQSYLPKNTLALLTTSTTKMSTDEDRHRHHKKKDTTIASHGHHYSTKANEELKQVFTTFDKNGDGFLTKQEIQESLKMIGMKIDSKEVEEMVERLDSNGDGLIDHDEFCKLFETVSRNGVVLGSKEDNGGGSLVDDDGDLKDAFDVFDGDRDGMISVEELSLVLSSMGMKEGKRIKDCQEMIRMVDLDGDGMVNFDEFKKMMKAGGLGNIVSSS